MWVLCRMAFLHEARGKPDARPHGEPRLSLNVRAADAYCHDERSAGNRRSTGNRQSVRARTRCRDVALEPAEIRCVARADQWIAAPRGRSASEESVVKIEIVTGMCVLA